MNNIMNWTRLAVTLVACQPQQGGVEPPPKPESVPADAPWVGDPDGGVFVEISQKQEGAGRELMAGYCKYEYCC